MTARQATRAEAMAVERTVARVARRSVRTRSYGTTARAAQEIDNAVAECWVRMLHAFGPLQMG
jgi:hypothetical protein